MAHQSDDWVIAVRLGDEMLFDRADPLAAVDQYQFVLDDLLPIREETFNEWAEVAVVVHRIGLAEQIAGMNENAIESFHRVDLILNEARENAENEIAVEYIDSLHRYSVDQRWVVSVHLKDDANYSPSEISMSVLCEHGCPWFTWDCGLPERHC